MTSRSAIDSTDTSLEVLLPHFDIDNKIFDVGHVAELEDVEHDDRSRCFMLLLYPDNPEMFMAYEKIRTELDWKYAAILHDQEGKPHFHLVVTFPNDRKARALSKDLDLPVRWIRPWNSVTKAHRYLCHRDHPDKYQYKPDDITGTDAEAAFKRCLKDAKTSEADDIAQIIKLLDETPFYLKTSELLSLISKAGLWSAFRRLGRFGEKLVDEHNAKYASW